MRGDAADSAPPVLCQHLIVHSTRTLSMLYYTNTLIHKHNKIGRFDKLSDLFYAITECYKLTLDSVEAIVFKRTL